MDETFRKDKKVRDPEEVTEKRVGVAGFEPTTPSTPRKCATRLRYTPKSSKRVLIIIKFRD
jgi:hypothetical protein